MSDLHHNIVVSLQTLCGNPDLCRSLSEGDIRQIYSLATTDTNLEYCDFYSTLQTIMKVLVQYCIQ